MGEQELFNGLIATYRDLNLKVRPLSEERLNLGRARSSVRGVIIDMRDDELRFSQALKSRLAGGEMVNVLTPSGGNVDADEIYVDGGDSTIETLSQFGTARESTLAMLRGMAPEQWDDTAQGSLTIRAASDALLANDKVHMEKVVKLLGSPSGN